MSQSKIEKFKEKELKQLKEERDAYLEDQDYKEFIKWPQGVTDAILCPVIPRDHLSFGKAKKVFRVNVDGVEYDWSVTRSSPMYGDMLELLSYKEVKFRLQRMGEGIQTRYSLI